MQKTPLYIGIFAENSKEARKEAFEFSRQSLMKFEKNSKDKLVQADIEQMQARLTFPKDNLHITTLFIGGNENKMKKNKNQLKQFQYGVKVPISIKALLYVPGYILVGYCHKFQHVKIQNQYPHVTLLLSSQAKPVESNLVLEKVFNLHPELLQTKQEYKKIQVQFKQSKVVYFMKCDFKLDGVTGSNWTNGKK